MNEENQKADFAMAAVGRVRSRRQDAANTDYWGAVVSTIVIDERFGSSCLTGLEEFSHVEVVFVFDQVRETDTYRDVRPARGRQDMPSVGIFCSRGPNRPNRIGVSTCRILDVNAARLTVLGLDAIDGTPVLDLKPVMVELLPREVEQPDWVGRLMRDYQKS